jgi:hypothetical protein
MKPIAKEACETPKHGWSVAQVQADRALLFRVREELGLA